jgi:hypothetical protein
MAWLTEGVSEYPVGDASAGFFVWKNNMRIRTKTGYWSLFPENMIYYSSEKM